MSEPSEFTQIPTGAVRALVEEEPVDLEVFLPGEPDQGPIPYHAMGTRLAPPDFAHIGADGVTSLYIHAEDYHRCAATLEHKLTAILSNPNVTSEDKAVVVQRVGVGVARDLLAGSVESRCLDRASTVVDCMICSVLNDASIVSSLLEMAGHERSTAGHMFAVATLGAMLGAEVLGSDHEKLRSVALAGMLHDVGKLSIGAEVLNKAEPLTRAELELIHQHPIESVRLIGDNAHVTAIVRQMILQHHERIDGKGYPLGLDGSSLLLESRMLSIVDSFHAMIGRRPYRTPMTPCEASRLLATQAGRQFDADLMGRWTELFERSWSPEATERARKALTTSDELSARYEHRPALPAPKDTAQRPPRFPCNGKKSVRCIYAGRLIDATAAPDEFTALAHDVSRGGLCIYAAHPMYRGEVVRVKIDKHEDHLWIDSVVAWCRRQDACVYRIGLRFLARINESQIHELCAVRTMSELLESQQNPCENMPDSAEQGPARKTAIADQETAGDTRESALSALAAIASIKRVTSEAQNTAITLSMSEDAAVRLKAVDVVATIRTKAAHCAFVSLLNDATAEVRERAAVIAGTYSLVDLVGPLREMLRDSVTRIALRAAGALGRFGDDSGLRLVALVLKDDCPETRLAAQAFGEITGHRFPANQEGVQAARRYLAAKKSTLVR